MSEPLILLVEDDASIRHLLDIALQANGFRTRHAASAQEGETEASMFPPALILLDLGLPDRDGQSLLAALRGWYKGPIVIISARNEEGQIIRALDSGANDYLTKPFRMGELLARVRAALRLSFTDSGDSVRHFGDLSIDLAARTVRKQGETVKLTSTEYALLSLLVRNAGRVLTHTYILQQVWGPGYVERTEYPRVFVGQLRKKIEKDPNFPELILTESGVGYRFREA